jgi:parallel beta-helix repeat protein
VNGNVENFKITNNKVHDNNNIGIDAIGFEGTASANDQARNGIISGNTVYNIESYGNVAYGTDRSADGIYVDGGKNIVIERNIVYHCNIGIELASEHAGKSTSGVVMRSNFISFCGVCGIAMGGYDTKRGSTDSCRVLNNTLYANDTLHWETGEFMLQYNMRRNIIRNNLVYANSQNVFMSSAFTQDTANVFNNNLYYFLPGSNDKASFQFQSASGNDANSLSSDPFLKNVTSMPPDLHVLKNSPAINAGVLVDSVGVYDIDGDARVIGAIDIGADEYVGGTKVENESLRAGTFILKQNYPNPFNPSTTIEYTLLKACRLQLTITDIEGREVARLVDAYVPAGTYRNIFSAQNLASGVYFYHLKAGEIQQTKQMILLK